MGVLGLCYKKKRVMIVKRGFLRSLLEQAKHFYITAETSPVKSQLSFLLLFISKFIKIIINLTGQHGSKKMYMHGMNENHNNKFSQSTITKQKQKQKIVQVAHEIVSIFDPNIAKTDVLLNVKELLNHCVGVHRAYSEIYNQTEVFYKIANYKLFKKGKELIFKAELQCSDIDMASLTACGY
nr:hypothetical protein [Proteus mirabilis]